jgi:hypothetical protein
MEGVVMKRKWVPGVIIITIPLALVALTVGLVSAQRSDPEHRTAEQEAALGTSFTYQGRLESDDEPVDETCDFKFTLHDAATLGSQVGVTQTESITVTAGLFTADLDFGAGAFNGDARWLGIRVNCPADTGYVDLGRQELTASPYSLYAQTAPWSGLSSVPAGFADNNDGVEYQGVIVVAKSGGDFTSVQSALDSVTGTVSNRYLIWVAPGTYSETVTMEPYVDIEGAGETATMLTAAGSVTYTSGATVRGASNAELRSLSVENIGGRPYAIAIYNENTAPQISQVTIRASGAAGQAPSGGGNNYGIFNRGLSYPPPEPTLRDLSIRVTGAVGFSAHYGIYNDYASPRMEGIYIYINAASLFSSGCGVYNSLSSPTLWDMDIYLQGTDNTTIYGVWNTNSSWPEIRSVVVDARGGAGMGGGTVYGLYNNQSRATVVDSAFSTMGMGTFGTSTYGLFNTAASGAYTVTVEGSSIGGGATISSDAEFVTRVGSSRLDGGAIVLNGGSVTCAGVYDEGYGFFASTCP